MWLLILATSGGHRRLLYRRSCRVDVPTASWVARRSPSSLTAGANAGAGSGPRPVSAVLSTVWTQDAAQRAQAPAFTCTGVICVVGFCTHRVFTRVPAGQPGHTA